MESIAVWTGSGLAFKNIFCHLMDVTANHLIKKIVLWLADTGNNDSLYPYKWPEHFTGNIITWRLISQKQFLMLLLFSTLIYFFYIVCCCLKQQTSCLRAFACKVSPLLPTNLPSYFSHYYWILRGKLTRDVETSGCHCHMITSLVTSVAWTPICRRTVWRTKDQN